MALLSDYTAGTVTVSAGGTDVTGVGTAWLTAGFQEGDEFFAPGWHGIIQSVNSNTSLTLYATGIRGAALAGSAYRLRYQGDGSRVTAQARQLVEMLGAGNLTALSGLVGLADRAPYFTGAGTMALSTLTAHARAILALSGGNGKFIRSTGATTAVLQDILGTVAQSGGVPTGSIVERGSNANGEYARFADGTQICVSGSVEVPYNGVTSLQGSAVTWPAAFASGTTYAWADSILAASGGANHRLGMFAPTTANTTSMVPRYLVGSSTPYVSGDTRTIRIAAIGRWF